MDLKDSKGKVNVLKATGIAVACDERCGCPSPCPGGVASGLQGLLCGHCSREFIHRIGCCCIRCASGDISEVDGHRRCSCGDQCSCNPCTCANAVAGTGIGKAFCKCGDGCTCTTCAS